MGGKTNRTKGEWKGEHANQEGGQERQTKQKYQKQWKEINGTQGREQTEARKPKSKQTEREGRQKKQKGQEGQRMERHQEKDGKEKDKPPHQKGHRRGPGLHAQYQKAGAGPSTVAWWTEKREAVACEEGQGHGD